MLNREKLRGSAGERRELEYYVAGRRDVRDGVSQTSQQTRRDQPWRIFAGELLQEI